MAAADSQWHLHEIEALEALVIKYGRNWKLISDELGTGRSTEAVRRRARAMVAHEPFNEIERLALEQLVITYGPKWSRLAQQFLSKAAHDLRLEWETWDEEVRLRILTLHAEHADEDTPVVGNPRVASNLGMPNIRWTRDEDARLFDVCIKLAPNPICWKDVSEDFPGRTPSALRNRWGRFARSATRPRSQRCSVCGQLRRGHICAGPLENGAIRQGA